ncbi:MAG: hypothetical protein R3C11_09915 [Planctomycetaceae bacterium]
MIEQTANHTASWFWKAVSTVELEQLVNWFEDTTRPLPVKADTHRNHYASTELQQLWLGERSHYWHSTSESVTTVPAPSTRSYLNSFQPPACGASGVTGLAEQKLQTPVHYELPIRNAEKPFHLSVTARTVGPVQRESILLSRSATFIEKSIEFPQVTFVIGADTAIRIVDARFYESEVAMLEALSLLAERECRFLVAPRRWYDMVLSEQNVKLPDSARPLFQFIDPDEFCMDISSTQLREQAF